MPFTAAHPMAVLPALRWRRRLGLDATCLVIGSMAPDIEYFVRLHPVATISHTLRGLILWSLPVTLVAAVLVHGLAKWPVLLAAPVGIARRAAVVISAPWQPRRGIAAVASCAVSAVLGAATHLFWDGFTHANGWAPQRWLIFSEPLQLPLTGTIIVHRLLQHLSTLIGMVVLAIVIVRWLRHAQPIELPDQPRAAARVWLGSCVAVGLVLTLGRLVILQSHQAKPVVDIGDWVVAIISGSLAGILVASVILIRRARRFRAAVGPTL